MDWITAPIANLYHALSDRFIVVLGYPLASGERVFWLYLLSSVSVAWLIYRRRSTDQSEGNSFFGFLFPKKVWNHASAWLDVRYFFFHQLLGKLGYVILLAFTVNAAFQWVTGGPNMVSVAQTAPDGGWRGVAISIGYMFLVVAVVDFVAFFLHYLQHKVPILWEFHKVHHSSEVMHPLSNYREHPIDNFTYAIGTGIAYGLFMGLARVHLGYVPTMPQVLGLPVIFFLFNIAGYNLRHSHIWLRWPGRWSMIFPSPAHHHVHHSRHPEHLDKNFAFVFPLWDVLFRTYEMPETDKDVEFGIYGQQGETEYSTCWRLYYLPFRNIFRKLRQKPEPAKAPVSSPVQAER